MKTILAKVFLMLSIVILLGAALTQPTFAISQDDLNSILDNTPFYDPNATQCSVTAGSTTATGSGSGSSGSPNVPLWNSNVQPPYYLEEFVIQVLDALASAENLPSSDTVTQQHVLALVAWAWEEGGDIANQDLFNPWNNGLDDPSLLATAAAGNGVQSFKSFDAGVTANVIVFLGSNQNRLAQVLSDPTSSAADFMSALTYYQKYPGNQFWAEADKDNQSAYYSELMQVLQQTQTNYASEATIQMGIAYSERQPHVAASLLQYNGPPDSTAGTTVSSTTDASCAGSGADNVNCNSSGSTSTAGLSEVRQNVVCIAEQQLAVWTAQPGYPHPAYSETGYKVYSAGAAEEWCADFASWVYNQAGYPFSGGYNGGWRISYVPNIQALGEQNQNFHWHPENASGTSYTPKPGDLAIHGSQHVNIVIAVNGNNVTLIGGDQGSGPYPGGSIVSYEYATNYSEGGDITGYVSPD